MQARKFLNGLEQEGCNTFLQSKSVQAFEDRFKIWIELTGGIAQEFQEAQYTNPRYIQRDCRHTTRHLGPGSQTCNIQSHGLDTSRMSFEDCGLEQLFNSR